MTPRGDSRLGCPAEAKRGALEKLLSTTTQPDAQPHLIRALGRRDLVLLFVVAVFNLNVVPSIAANGGVTIWLWIISLLLFFWPQGIAVIELAHRYPGEGGVYLWAKEVFGDFHGFLSGWCYWTNNMLYVPTVMLYFVGVSVYVLGPGHHGLADNKLFAASVSLALLALLTLLNILGLGVGKWINNLGAIGTFIAAAVLIGLGVVIWSRFGSGITAADFKIPANPNFVLNSFGVICFGLVGLELASVMGDEIQGSAPHSARRGRLGRPDLRRSLCRGDAHAADRRRQERQRAAGNRAGGHRNGGSRRRQLDLDSLRAHAQPLDRRHRFGLDGRLRAHPIRRRTRFLYAVVARQGSSALRHAVCRLIVQGIVSRSW